jgi:hypothetical protein
LASLRRSDRRSFIHREGGDTIAGLLQNRQTVEFSTACKAVPFQKLAFTTVWQGVENDHTPAKSEVLWLATVQAGFLQKKPYGSCPSPAPWAQWWLALRFSMG